MIVYATIWLTTPVQTTVTYCDVTYYDCLDDCDILRCGLLRLFRRL